MFFLKRRLIASHNDFCLFSLNWQSFRYWNIVCKTLSFSKIFLLKLTSLIRAKPQILKEVRPMNSEKLYSGNKLPVSWLELPIECYWYMFWRYSLYIVWNDKREIGEVKQKLSKWSSSHQKAVHPCGLVLLCMINGIVLQVSQYQSKRVEYKYKVLYKNLSYQICNHLWPISKCG